MRKNREYFFPIEALEATLSVDESTKNHHLNKNIPFGAFSDQDVFFIPNDSDKIFKGIILGKYEYHNNYYMITVYHDVVSNPSLHFQVNRMMQIDEDSHHILNHLP